MVLEALINPIKAERRQWETFFIGIAYASLSIIVSLFLFKDFSSVIMVSLTAMVSVPLIYGAIRLEEKKDLVLKSEKKIMKEHTKALSFFIFLFLGFTVAFIGWYIALPEDLSETLFKVQTNTIEEINSPATGNFINISSTIAAIFFNNIKVMLFCMLFAFFYGFGAIFILTWNASVIGAVIGAFIRNNTGSVFLAPLILLKYLLHGIPEIMAYFMAGLAGGIISIAIVRKDFDHGKFKKIFVDSINLSAGAIVLLIIAALIEVFISPLVY